MNFIRHSSFNTTRSNIEIQTTRTINSNNARTRITKSNLHNNPGTLGNRQIILHSLDLNRIRKNRTESRHQEVFKAGLNNQFDRPKTGKTPHINTFIPDRFRKIPNFAEQIQVDYGPRENRRLFTCNP